jgi:hypothetical protein
MDLIAGWWVTSAREGGQMTMENESSYMTSTTFGSMTNTIK